MNKFQKNILQKFPQFTINDFKYFGDAAMLKVMALGLPIFTCNIADYFQDSINPLFYRAEYCLCNCGLKCHIVG